MPSYDDYRMSDAQRTASTGIRSGDPYAIQNFSGGSSSLFGNLRENQIGGKPSGTGYGAMGLTTAMTAPYAYAGGLLNDSFLKKGNVLDNLRSMDSWKNVITLGHSGSRKKKAAAKKKRRNAVAAWQAGENERVSSLLGQQGQDVKEDLAGEYAAALASGGDMGNAAQIQSATDAFQDRYNRYMLGRQRAVQSRQVDAMMTDPGRLADRSQRLENTRQDGIRQLADQFRMGARNNAFNQARRGTQGGSVDIEQRGDLARERNAGGRQLQAGVDQMAQNYRLGDQRQRATLMGLIHSDDPNSAALFQNTLQGINDSSQNEQERFAQDRQMQQFRTASGGANSQILGNTLTQLGTGIGNRMDQEGTGA